MSTCRLQLTVRSLPLPTMLRAFPYVSGPEYIIDEGSEGLSFIVGVGYVDAVTQAQCIPYKNLS